MMKRGVSFEGGLLAGSLSIVGVFGKQKFNTEESPAIVAKADKVNNRHQ